MKSTFRAFAILALVLSTLTLNACREASAAEPSGDYTKVDHGRWFTSIVNFDGIVTATANILRPAGATQVLTAGGTIAADGCGGLKPISSATALTTSLVNTFAAPAAANSGCCMVVLNLNAVDAITLDFNANYVSAGAADVVLGTGDTVRVCSTGAGGKWYQVAYSNN